MYVPVKRISFPSAATLALASGNAAWEGMERTGTTSLAFYFFIIYLPKSFFKSSSGVLIGPML
jgi:hypothetical protein